MDLQLVGKIYFVAGASRGLGYAIAEQLALNGASVAIASRDETAIQIAAQTLVEHTGQQVAAYVMDARDEGSIAETLAAVQDEFGGLDGLVVNAGGPPPGYFDDFDDDDWQRAFELTLLSAVRMIRGSLPSLKQRGGSILAITSSTVKEPAPGMILSNVMRSGVSSLIKTLSRELAADSIRINNLVPGRIDTDRVKSLDQDLALRLDITTQEARERYEEAIPMGRYGNPTEFGKVGAFLLSPAASYITGATLTVDGGTMKSLF